MNSYNENLNASVLASLQSQELDQQVMEAQLNAATFTLYYAEGAKITANEKLDTAANTYSFQNEVKATAVNNNNISINLLASANQEKQYVAQSVTNAAVAAANVQVANNAILRLASDIGSIYSIVNAADYGSHIYDQAKIVNDLMGDTAYNAELTSQLAMEASSYTAEVSASTVADQAKITNTAVGNLLKVVSSQFDSTAADVASKNATLAVASSDEKKAEGILEDVNVEYFASQAAYLLSVSQLNLNLQVKLPTKIGADYKYKVTFNTYQNPFQNAKLAHASEKSISKNSTPVQTYYIMLAKDSAKSIFSISKAEAIISENQKSRFIPVTTENSTISKELFISDMDDTDGDAMEMGVNYVVFVLAQFKEEYKKTLNNFDDYLTAPSAKFALTNQLNKPKHTDIHVIPNKSGDAQLLEFNLEENKQFKVEYRCMFLPDNSDLIRGLLTEKGLRRIENEVEKLEEIAELYDPQIVTQEAYITSLNTTIAALEEKLIVNQEHPRTSALIKEETSLIEQLKNDKHHLSTAKQSLKKLNAEKKAAMSKIEPAKDAKPGFYFNRLLAEKVPAGNYTVAHTPKEQPKEKGKDLEKEKGTGYKMFYKQMTISDATTDNFGNPLIAGKKYIPVILAVAVVDDENQGQFTNALSAYQTTKSFHYNPK